MWNPVRAASYIIAALWLPLFASAQTPAEVVPWSSGVSYTYDPSGNARQIGKDAFVYDYVGRLIQADVNGVRRNYEYDAFGNRTKCLQNAGTAMASDCQTYAIRSDDNHIIQAGYDAAGNVTSLGGHVYSYDQFNMMKRDQSGDAREFVYTAGGERLATYAVAGRSWRWTLRDTSNNVLRELTSQGGALGTAAFQWVRDYVWRDDLLLATRQPEGASTTTYHYHLDHLGTPRRITDNADNLAGFHDYFVYGPEVSGGKNEPSLTRVKYTGQERDDAGDLFGTLDYMHARYYNPGLGRFLSTDAMISARSIGRPQGWNRYTYALNNPLRFVDPTGLDIILTACKQDGGSSACADELAAAKAAFGPAWKHVNYKDGVITLKRDVSPHWLGQTYGPTAHALGFMAASRDHFSLIGDAAQAAQGEGAYTKTLPGGGANIYYDPAKFGGGKEFKVADVVVGLAEAFVHESGHAIEPYFADVREINANYGGNYEATLRREAFPVFLENHWRRKVFGVQKSNDIRTFYKMPNDINYSGTKLEDIWP